MTLFFTRPLPMNPLRILLHAFLFTALSAHAQVYIPDVTLSLTGSLTVVETDQHLTFNDNPNGGTPQTTGLTNHALASNGASAFESSSIDSYGDDRLNNGSYGAGIPDNNDATRPWISLASDPNGWGGVKLASPTTLARFAFGSRFDSRSDGIFTMQYTTDSFAAVDLETPAQVDALTWITFGTLTSTTPNEFGRHLFALTTPVANVTGVRIVASQGGSTITEIEAYAPVTPISYWRMGEEDAPVVVRGTGDVGEGVHFGTHENGDWFEFDGNLRQARGEGFLVEGKIHSPSGGPDAFYRAGSTPTFPGDLEDLVFFAHGGFYDSESGFSRAPTGFEGAEEGTDNWMKVIRDGDGAVSWAQFEFDFTLDNDPPVVGPDPMLIDIPLYVMRPDGADFTLAEAVAVVVAATSSTADLVGGRTMSLFGAPAYDSSVSTGAAARTGSALCVDFATGDYGTSALIPALIDNFGIELWVKPDSTTGNKCLAYNGHTGTSGWGLYQLGATYQGLFGSLAFIGSGTAVAGQWTHLALVRDNGTTTFYINGVADPATTTTAPKPPAGNFGVAAKPQDPANDQFAGSLDEVRVFTFAAGTFSTDDLLIPPGVWNNLDSGPGSLRDAIATASSGDTLRFDATLAGQTITLTSGQLLIDKNLNIDASGMDEGVTISGDDSSRVFAITAGTTVAMHNLTITGGNATTGGGINNLGDLTIEYSTISNNMASGQGGGIRNQGTLVVNASTIVNNTAAANGGGIHNTFAAAVATITNSTFFNNTSNSSGGGAFNNTTDATATLVHVTVTGNSAPTSQGGGLRRVFGGTVTIENSIVAGNTAPSGANLIGVTQTGSNLTSGDPLLDVLGNYGGPTQTMPPLPGSLAIEGVVILAGTPATDQRGSARPSGALPDIGAVEVSLTAQQEWRQVYYGSPANSGAGADSALATNGTSNLQSFAFGLDPTTPAGALDVDTVADTITTLGPPTIWVDPATGRIYLRSTRRADFAAVGLNIVEEFSRNPGLPFETSAVPPTVIANGSNGGMPIEAVQTEFPLVLPLSGGNGRYGRVDVTMAP